MKKYPIEQIKFTEWLKENKKEQIIDRLQYHIGLDYYELNDVFDCSPFAENEILGDSRKPEIIIWRNIAMVWSFMKHGSFTEAKKEIGKSHSLIMRATRMCLSEFENMNVVDHMRPHMEKVIEYVTNDSSHKTECISSNEYIALINMENKLNK